jgi:hypothetical protein
MTQRVNYAEQSPELLKKFTEFLAATRESAIEEPIRDLVAIRAAQSFIVMVVNYWNRLNIGFKTVPGSADAKFSLNKAELS